MEMALPSDLRWDSEILRRMGTLVEKNYFVPLGVLPNGRYRMRLLLTEDARVSVQLVSEKFDMAVDDCFESVGNKITMYFSISDTEKYYFRMYPRRPVQLSEIILEPATDQEASQ